jgi:hypothetical protein
MRALVWIWTNDRAAGFDRLGPIDLSLASNGDHVVFDQDKDMGDILVLGGVQKTMG